MNEIFVSPTDKAVIELGKQGENMATLVRFNLSGFVGLYGVGHAELLHIRRGGSQAHPVPTVQMADELQWLVSAADTEVPGVGYVELRYYVDGTLAKSVTWSVRVREALDAGDAPAPAADWFDQLAKLKTQIVDAFEKLKAFAADLKEKLERGELDGFSPIAQVRREHKRAVITITDREGTTTADVYDGVPGEDCVGSINGVKPDATGAVTLTAGDLGAYTTEQTDSKIHDLNQYVTRELGEVDTALEQREKTINKASAITSSNVDESHYPSTKAMADYVASQVPTAEEKQAWNAKVDTQMLEEAEQTLHNEITAARAAIPTKLSELAGDATHRTVTDEQIAAWSTSGIVVEIGSYQYVYKGKVLPAISAAVLATVYVNDKAGVPQVLHWTLYGSENNLKVVSSDLIAGTYSIDVLVHNQFHCEYKWTVATTGNVNPTIMETEINEATEVTAGVVALATHDDVAAGINDTKAVTPKKLAAVYRDSDAQDVIDQTLSDRIDRIETGAFPNATFVGEPLIVGSNVSRFTNADYMIFPFVVDVRGKAFSIDFAFRTGADVATQQNILDSRFGLALAIRNGKGLMAMSSNGTSWDIGQSIGAYTIAPNSVYYARLAWDGTKYTTGLSTDGTEYVVDMTLNSSLGLHPETIYIGGSPDLFGVGTSHPFSGGIDMSHAKLLISGSEVWRGMDTPGLATRANISLSNLDAVGEHRFTEMREGITAAERATDNLKVETDQFAAEVRQTASLVIENAITANMLPDGALMATGISYADGVYTGTASAFANAFKNGIPGLMLEAGQQYTVSATACRTASSTSTSQGIGFYAQYTDGTVDVLCKFPNNTNEPIRLSGTTSGSKYIDFLYMSFGSSGSSGWRISDVQIEKGSTATDYTPHMITTAVDRMARNKISDIDSKLDDNVQELKDDVQELFGDVFDTRAELSPLLRDKFIGASTGALSGNSSYPYQFACETYIPADRPLYFKVAEGFGYRVYKYDANKAYIGAENAKFQSSVRHPDGESSFIRINVRTEDASVVDYDGCAGAVQVFRKASDSGSKQPLKIMAIGNSWMRDSIRGLSGILDELGYAVTIGHCYLGGSDLGNHYFAMHNSQASYKGDPEVPGSGTIINEAYAYIKYTDGVSHNLGNHNFKYVCMDEPWDVVIFMRGRGHFGREDCWVDPDVTTVCDGYWDASEVGKVISWDANTFLDEVLGLIPNKNVRMYECVPWSYAPGSTNLAESSYEYWLGDDPVPTTQEGWDALYEKIHEGFQKSITRDVFYFGNRLSGIINIGQAIWIARHVPEFKDYGWNLQRSKKDFHLAVYIPKYIASSTIAMALTGANAESFRWFNKSGESPQSGELPSPAPTSGMAALARRAAEAGLKAVPWL